MSRCNLHNRTMLLKEDREHPGYTIEYCPDCHSQIGSIMENLFSSPTKSSEAKLREQIHALKVVIQVQLDDIERLEAALAAKQHGEINLAYLRSLRGKTCLYGRCDFMACEHVRAHMAELEPAAESGH